MLEFALVLPLLLMFLLGIMDFGVTYNNWISLRQGVAEAARQGSVANFGTDSTCTLTFTAGSSSVPSADLQKLMCLAKDQIGHYPASTRIKIIVADYSLQTSGAPWMVGNGLIVCAQYPANSATGFFSFLLAGHYLETKTTIRIEQPSAVAETGGWETDQSGEGWPWCTASSTSP